jgi:subtilisin family serine protease
MPLIPEESLHKLAPKLRMVVNGNDVVNTLRAERSPSLMVRDESLLQNVPTQRDVQDKAIKRDQLPPEVKREHLVDLPSAIYANVFIQLASGVDEMPQRLRQMLHERETSRNGNLLVTTVELNRLPDLLADPAVVAVESADQIAFYPPVDISYTVEAPTSEPAPAAPEIPPAEESRQEGEAQTPDKPQVLIGIVDVQGFDFAHSDFLNPDGTTRFVRIWDQGSSYHPAPEHFAYGSELTAEMMNAAIRSSGDPRFSLPPTSLEPQSQMVPGSHGTHVASIAAGNSGACPRAAIAGVLISLPLEDQDRRKSFYDSTRLVHAVEYLFRLGEQLKLPVSINISLGTNGHAHDASSMISRWIDYELATAGRSICVAAGNAGQEKPARPGDWGYVTGRIHTGGSVIQKSEENNGQPAVPCPRDIFWQVVGDGIADLSENELELWYSPGDHFAVMLKAPDQDKWIGPVEPGQYIQNLELKPSGTFVSIYNELYHPANGNNYIALYLSPFFSTAGVVGVLGGMWTVRLLPREVRDGSYHAWIERDDPRRMGRYGSQEGWSFPSFFTERSNVDNTSVGSLACGNYIISVANYDEESKEIHITSSQGPTRDGRNKPDICAPGTNITAANGFDPTRRWVAMTGTSMASPRVAGVVGRMLAADPSLTAAQIEGIIRRTAVPLTEGAYAWCDNSGYGLLDAEACLTEIERLHNRKEIESL